MAKELSELASENIIDSRDIIERLEELKDERESLESDVENAKDELKSIQSNIAGLLEDAKDIDPENDEVCANFSKEIETLEEKEEEAKEALQDAEAALADWDKDYKEEFDELERINDECSGYGDWEHGATLIDENHFPDYVQQFAEDIGAIGNNSDWIVIDWEATAENLKSDYTSVEIDGNTFYYRA